MKTDDQLIAGYMRYPYHPVKAGFENGGSYTSIDKYFESIEECLKYCDEVNVGRHPENSFYPLPRPSGFSDFELKYSKSWDWLMPVVEKINNDSDFNCIQIRPTHVSLLYRNNKGNIRKDKWYPSDEMPLIECVYRAVVKSVKTNTPTTPKQRNISYLMG